MTSLFKAQRIMDNLEKFVSTPSRMDTLTMVREEIYGRVGQGMTTAQDAEILRRIDAEMIYILREVNHAKEIMRSDTGEVGA